MEIIDAFWERRNLGVTSTEIVINRGDELNHIEAYLKTCDAEYVVCKVPVNRFDVNSLLTKYGYSYVETSINFVLNVKDAILNPLQTRLNKVISCSEMNEADIEILYQEISKGLFDTDRIALDNKFTKQQAANRYKNWIADESRKGTKLFNIQYKEDTIGFFTFKNMGGETYYPFLGGIYQKYNTSGLGFSVVRKPIEEVIRQKGKKISTYVSSNNLTIIKSHIQQGYIFNDNKYVFIKHQ